MRAGGENVTADQLKAGRALAQTIDAQNKAGVGIGAATAQVALFGGATSDVVSKQSAAATAFSKMAADTDPEGITQSQKALKEATNTQDKLTNQFAELTVEGKRFNTEMGHLNTRILPAYAEAISTVTAGMRGAVQGISKVVERPESAREMGRAVFDLMLAELKNIGNYLKPGISSLVDSVINWSKGGGATTKASGKAMGGAVNARMPYMVGEIGPELFVPGMSGQIVSNQNLTKQLQTMQQNLVTSVDQQKKQMAASAIQPYQMPDPTAGINEAMQNMLQGPYGFATVMDGVKKQLSEDSNKQFSVLQEQIGKLDELVREMRNNTSANENIANMLA
jgi:predicted transcriptional regulator